MVNGENRYTYITKHNLLRLCKSDAIRHGFSADYENRTMTLESLWIEHIHPQVMEWQASHQQWTNYVYVQLPGPEERKPYNIRRHTAIANNPHDYGYLTWTEAASLLGITEEELQQKNIRGELEYHQVLIYAPGKPYVIARSEIEQLQSGTQTSR